MARGAFEQPHAQLALEPAPQVVAGVCVVVTGDEDGARRRVADLPGYRTVPDRSGYASAADAVVAGDEEAVARQLRRYVDAGATECRWR